MIYYLKTKTKFTQSGRLTHIIILNDSRYPLFERISRYYIPKLNFEKMAEHLKDHTSKTDLKAHYKGTGPVRKERPVYMDFLPPCNNACPAGENIQNWLSHAQAGDFRAAWQALVQDNPFPALMGRVCYHPCESSCNRNEVDSTVSIHAIERYIGDLAIENNWDFEMPGEEKKTSVMVVGAGPSGLSAAYHLRRRGYKVTIYDAGPVAGGMMHFGIPAYRLPRNIMEAEIARLERMGVKIILDTKIEDLLAVQHRDGHDAIFVAVGAHLSKRVDIPGREAGRIMDALSFLKRVEQGEEIKLGRRVAIYGGGNTAMDAARTAKRLGLEPLIIYRRDREHMPAHDFEADEALAEGVKINWLRTIKEMDSDKLKVEVMELDDKGKPVPTGKYEELEADALILALGQETDTTFMKKLPRIKFKDDGTVIVDEHLMTGHPGVFAGGDMVPSERTVTVGIGHGKKAACYIDLWLSGIEPVEKEKNPIVGYERLHVWFGTQSPRKTEKELQAKKRIRSFDEIIQSLSREEAVYEAQRCLSCGNCFECDACYGSCPEGAVIKLGKGNRYKFNYDICTGCAVCYEQCPCHAIEMKKEPAV